jgi:1,5-anhydro-D-fructose reductase (1,5-anhydro-D-mannitol-forming)
VTLGWGIIGTGSIADSSMAPAIAKAGDTRLVGVVSRDRGRADAFAKKHGAAHAYTNYDDLLRNTDVEVVLITTPNAQHADQVVAAAKAGKHVLCDKPLALSIADAERAIEACQKAGVKLGINFQIRHYVPVREIRQMIEDGLLGEIITVQAEASPGVRRLAGWRADRGLAGLGAVNNIAVHVFDMLRYLLRAEVSEVMAMFDTGRGNELETQALTVLRFDNGAMAYANCNQNTPNPQNDLDIYGTTGRVVGVHLTREEKDGELRVLLNGNDEKRTPYSNRDGWDRLVAAYCDAIINNRDPNPSGIDGLRSVQLCDAIVRSAREGRLVHVKI